MEEIELPGFFYGLLACEKPWLKFLSIYSILTFSYGILNFWIG